MRVLPKSPRIIILDDHVDDDLYYPSFKSFSYKTENQNAVPYLVPQDTRVYMS